MILGTRSSRLAMAQTELVIASLKKVAPELKVELRTVRTAGDKDKGRPLRALGGTGAFTKELDEMILEGGIDAAVNSLKDIPVALTPGTTIAAVLPRGPVEDVLVSHLPLEELPAGASVGTSSVHRAATLRRLRPDLVVKDLRGNVPTRLRKLREGQYDAIILARAGVERLGIRAECHVLDPTVFVPSAGQGAVAVACREDSAFLEVLRRIDDGPTREEVEAERRVLGFLGGGCYVPIGVHASDRHGGLAITANIMDEDGGRFASSSIELGASDEDGLERFARALLEGHERSAEVSCKRGEVFLVGAGPGDPDLITVRGQEVLRSAEVVVHDALIDKSLLALAPEEAEVIDVGKRGSSHKAEQREINRLLVDRASAGKRVVRLKGGDPFLFGRGGEEAEALRGWGIPVHVVPGVSSAIAVPSLAGIPLTHRAIASYLTIVTGHESADKLGDAIDWDMLARMCGSGGTLVILMGISSLDRNMRRLEDGGLDARTSVAVVEKGCSPGQRTVIGTLGDISGRCSRMKISAPAVIVVGEVARLRELLGDLE